MESKKGKKSVQMGTTINQRRRLRSLGVSPRKMSFQEADEALQACQANGGRAPKELQEKHPLQRVKKHPLQRVKKLAPRTFGAPLPKAEVEWWKGDEDPLMAGED